MGREIDERRIQTISQGNGVGNKQRGRKEDKCVYVVKYKEQV